MKDLKVLHQCGERVKTKSHNVLGAKSYVCRIYRGNIGRVAFLAPPILNRVKHMFQVNERKKKRTSTAYQKIFQEKYNQ